MMPQTFWTEDEVQCYTRALAKAHQVIKNGAASDLAKEIFLKEIEALLGWKVKP